MISNSYRACLRVAGSDSPCEPTGNSTFSRAG